jgi:hypothetical protein
VGPAQVSPLINTQATSLDPTYKRSWGFPPPFFTAGVHCAISDYLMQANWRHADPIGANVGMTFLTIFVGIDGHDFVDRNLYSRRTAESRTLQLSSSPSNNATRRIKTNICERLHLVYKLLRNLTVSSTLTAKCNNRQCTTHAVLESGKAE